MKVIYCADIHRDAGSANDRIIRIVEEKPDLLVHCGDLSSWGEWERSLVWLKKSFPNSQIALIPGNHDFYCNRKQPMLEIMNDQMELCNKYNIIYLQHRNLELNEQIDLVGSCLWYDYSFDLDRDYSERELEEGYGNGIQWNDMLSVDVGMSDAPMSGLLLGNVEDRISWIPERKRIVFISHCLPYNELNAHPPSLFNAYSGQRSAGAYLDTLGDRVIEGFCGHTHRPKTYKQFINIGSDYIGPVKYFVRNY